MSDLEIEIANGESKTLEFKENLPSQTIRYLKTIVAFANGNGGKIIFGVKDSTGEIVGLDESKVFRIADSITDAIYNNISSPVLCDVSVRSIHQKSLIVVEIFAGQHTPYYIKSLGLNQGCFIRVSATTRLADEETIRELTFEGCNKSFDLALQLKKEISKSQIKNLCQSLKQTALKNCTTDEEKKQIKSVSKNTLLSWKIIQEYRGKLVPTNAFDLLSDNSIWSAKIQCAVFKGTTRNIFIDRREYSGPIQKQIEEAYEFVLRNIRLGSTIEGLYRKDSYEIPTEAIRELIINAVVHRNYLESSKIQIALFDDRLEITSPGGFPKGVTFEKIIQGYSKIRNEGLANAFYYMKLIEHWGSGIPRITKLIQEAGLRDLEIIDMDGAIRVNIYRNQIGQSKKQYHQVNENKKSAINYIKNTSLGDKSEMAEESILKSMESEREYSCGEIAQMIGLKESRTRDYLKKLSDLGIIQSKGANRNRRYFIK